MSDGTLPIPPRRRFLRSRRRHERELTAWSNRAVTHVLELTGEREELRDKLRATRDQLRWLEDRQAMLEDADAVVDAATAKADALEAAAQARATELEQRAQEHALRMVEHVMEEANSILQHAREEAAGLRDRTSASLAASTNRVEQLGHVQLQVARSIRTALHTFEEGLVELEAHAPSRRFLPTVEAIEQAEAAAPAAELTWPVAISPVTDETPATPSYDAPNLLEVARHAAQGQLASARS